MAQAAGKQQEGQEEPVSLETKTPKDQIKDRESEELVIAFAGPIGSGIPNVKEQLVKVMELAGYEVETVKLSEYLVEAINQGIVLKGQQAQTEPCADRYFQMQDAGNELRARQPDLLAEYAINEILKSRKEKDPDKKILETVPTRTVYIIDQIKHPEEVNLLRAVYGNLFYVFGVLSSSNRRKSRLETEGIKPDEIARLVERDRKESEGHGQQLDKALKLADFFIRNDHSNLDMVERQIKRFIDLIHDGNGISPTIEEYGMYVAYASGLRSACLSRTVGAAIMDRNGSILSTGRNDVPKAGGGLYGPEDGDSDQRCVKIGDRVCHNDLYKDMLKKQIEKLVEHHVQGTDSHLDDNFAEEVANSIHKETRVGSLIEFSRSIHAEMDAIVALARNGGGATKGATLFTYTFPCHNCARHIIAAGIKNVYYLEPYEKSLARELHNDAISFEGNPEEHDTEKTKIEFMHFEGVAPRQYQNIFNSDSERKNKDTGRATFTSTNLSSKKSPQYLDDYREYELKVLEHFERVMDDMSK